MSEEIAYKEFARLNELITGKKQTLWALARLQLAYWNKLYLFKTMEQRRPRSGDLI